MKCVFVLNFGPHLSFVFRFLEEREEAVSSLELQVQELSQDANDRTQLLENIQNDKTTLSRALTQNKELKNQLAELQNAFVKLVWILFENTISGGKKIKKKFKMFIN